jgi:hypothetical protein
MFKVSHLCRQFVGEEPFEFRQAAGGGSQHGCAFLCYFLVAHYFKKRSYPYSFGVTGCPHGGQDVVGAGYIVTENFCCPAPYKQRTVVCEFVRYFFRSRYRKLKVFRGNIIGKSGGFIL